MYFFTSVVIYLIMARLLTVADITDKRSRSETSASLASFSSSLRLAPISHSTMPPPSWHRWAKLKVTL